MTWFTEDATPLLILCGIIALILLGVVYQTGRAVMLLPLAGVLVLGAAFWGIETLVVTEKEEVESVVYRAIDAVAANDLDGVLAELGPDALELRVMAQAKMKMVEIKEAKITDTPVVTINKHTFPPSATVTFMGRVNGAMKIGGISGPFVSRMTLALKQYDSGWKITGFETENPIP